MSEIIINSKGTLSTTAQTLVNDVSSAESNITSSASSLGNVADIDGINLSSAGKTLISNFNNIFTDFSNISQTASNYINNLIAFDIDDFSGETSNSINGATSSVTKAPSTATVSYTAGELLEGGMPIPVYYQQDYEDVYLTNRTTVSYGGCGYTSLAMVMSYLTGETVTPRDIVDDWSRQYYTEDNGMSNSLPEAFAEHHNLGSVTKTDDLDSVVEALKNNQPVISGQYMGTFDEYEGGHIITLRGITDDGKILVNDPNVNNAAYNESSFLPEEINKNAGWYWIFEAKK